MWRHAVWQPRSGGVCEDEQLGEECLDVEAAGVVVGDEALETLLVIHAGTIPRFSPTLRGASCSLHPPLLRLLPALRCDPRTPQPGHYIVRDKTYLLRGRLAHRAWRLMIPETYKERLTPTGEIGRSRCREAVMRFRRAHPG
jgi:hypothetical protein